MSVHETIDFGLAIHIPSYKAIESYVNEHIEDGVIDVPSETIIKEASNIIKDQMTDDDILKAFEDAPRFVIINGECDISFVKYIREENGPLTNVIRTWNFLSIHYYKYLEGCDTYEDNPILCYKKPDGTLFHTFTHLTDDEIEYANIRFREAFQRSAGEFDADNND